MKVVQARFFLKVYSSCTRHGGLDPPSIVIHTPNMKGGFVYLMANKAQGTIYLGVTADLVKRVYEHKSKLYPDSFTSKYSVFNLVYFERYETIEDAILREKQLKNWKRDWKIKLIEKENPEWHDLYQSLVKAA